MERIFKRIIEIENRAKEVYSEGVQEEHNMKEALMHDINKREEQIRQMANEKISQLVMQGSKEIDEKISGMDNLVKKKLILLEAVSQKRSEEWEEAIFRDITGE